MRTQTGKAAWIESGLEALRDHGIEGVRVERLAQTLGVTKGSFYWHFKDRAELLDDMLESWRSSATFAIIDDVEAAGGDAVARLRQLSRLAGRFDGRLEQAVRAWAARDAKAKPALDAIDRRRLEYLASLFLELDFSPADAAARARLVYHALIGELVRGEPVASAERLAERLDIIIPMLVRGLNP
jgi:AcrR family transcriptional regulator